jgi:hypothetical protein
MAVSEKKSIENMDDIEKVFNAAFSEGLDDLYDSLDHVFGVDDNDKGLWSAVTEGLISKNIGAALLKQMERDIESNEWGKLYNKDAKKTLGNVKGVIDDIIVVPEADKQITRNIRDGIITNNNKPILAPASNITRIPDGSIRMAQSDPADSALFAKIGGPFDTLVNGVFKTTDKIFNAVAPIPMQQTFVMEAIKHFSNEMSSKSNNGNNTIHFDTLRIEGRLELTSNGQSVDIMSELKNNPLLMRQLSRMLTEHISTAVNGGRGTLNIGIGSV